MRSGPEGRDWKAGKVGPDSDPDHNICNLLLLNSFNAKLNFDDSFNSYNIRLREFTESRIQSPFADGCNLIGHRLPLIPIEVYVCFARIQFRNITCKRNNLDPIQMLVGCIITDDDGWPSLPNFTTK